MPKSWLMVTVFLLSVLVFTLITMPAKMFFGQQQTLMVGGKQLLIHDVSGRALNGQARWQWATEQGTLSWRLARKGLVPGVMAEVKGAMIKASAWFTATPAKRVTIKDLNLNVNVDTMSALLELDAGGATGAVSGVVAKANISPAGPWSATGKLDYSGGDIYWPGGSAKVEPLELHLEDGEAGEIAALLHTRASTAALMNGEFSKEGFSWTVYRRWVKILGMSQGGNEDAEVFKVSDTW